LFFEPRSLTGNSHGGVVDGFHWKRWGLPFGKKNPYHHGRSVS